MNYINCEMLIYIYIYYLKSIFKNFINATYLCKADTCLCKADTYLCKADTYICVRQIQKDSSFLAT